MRYQQLILGDRWWTSCLYLNNYYEMTLQLTLQDILQIVVPLNPDVQLMHSSYSLACSLEKQKSQVSL